MLIDFGLLTPAPRYTDRSEYRIVVEAARAAGIARRVGPHTLRHSFATHLLEDGVGVVEQQIGRVDRLDSRWSQDFEEWRKGGSIGEPPRIEIMPIMFKGTYDEHTWSVLNNRWELLRGQLHGIVVSGMDMNGSTEEDKAVAAELNSQAPRLSPR